VYLSVQYLLAMGHRRFVVVLGAAAAAEVFMLLAIGPDLTGIAFALFALQLVCAACVLTVSFQTRAPLR
jgi:hypothetical protein